MIEVDIKLSVIHHSHGGEKKAMQSHTGPHFENTGYIKKKFLATIRAAYSGQIIGQHWMHPSPFR